MKKENKKRDEQKKKKKKTAKEVEKNSQEKEICIRMRIRIFLLENVREDRARNHDLFFENDFTMIDLVCA